MRHEIGCRLHFAADPLSGRFLRVTAGSGDLPLKLQFSFNSRVQDARVWCMAGGSPRLNPHIYAQSTDAFNPSSHEGARKEDRRAKLPGSSWKSLGLKGRDSFDVPLARADTKPGPLGSHFGENAVTTSMYPWLVATQTLGPLGSSLWLKCRDSCDVPLACGDTRQGPLGSYFGSNAVTPSMYPWLVPTQGRDLLEVTSAQMP